MRESIIVALIGFVGTLVSAHLAARAGIRAAEITAGRQAGGGEEERARRLRAKTLLNGVGLATVMGVILGLIANAVVSRVREGQQILGDFRSFREIKKIALSHGSDPLNVGPWVAAKDANVELSVGRVSGRGSDGALRLNATLSPAPGGTSATGVRLDKRDLPPGPITLIVAWIYVEKIEPAAAADLRVRLITNTENEDDAFLVIWGNEARLSPGTWTQVVWTRAGAKAFFWEKGQARTAGTQKCAFRDDGERFTSVELRVWAAARAYTGSVYVDDVRFYRLQ